MPIDLFTCRPSDITFDAVASFVSTAIAERLQAESLVIEFKARNDEGNIAKAVAAMANTDGGIIVVGVDESAADPIVGVEVSRHDAIVNSLRARVPDAMPEVIPVAVPSVADAVLLVLRVDPDAALHPVVLDGKVYKRIAGNSVGARRDEIVALCHRPTSLTTRALTTSAGGLRDLRVWDDEPGTDDPVEVRARARFVLPRRFEQRGYLGSPTIAAVEEALRGSPVPERILAEHLTRHERGVSWWERTRVLALLVDLTAPPSASRHRWRPSVDARARVYLRERILEATVAVRLRPYPDAAGHVLSEVGDVYGVLLATCWSAATAGRACTAALGADLAVQLPAFDAVTRGVFDRGPVRLGMSTTIHNTDDARPPDWTFPVGVPETAELDDLSELVKDWLHVPLFEHGMTDFEHHLTQLEPPRWALAAP